MKIEKLIDELEGMSECADPEISHARADEILIEALISMGGDAEELARAFEDAAGRVGFWYA